MGNNGSFDRIRRPFVPNMDEEERIKDFQSHLTARMRWDVQDEMPTFLDRKENNGDETVPNRQRSYSRSGWVRNVDFFSDKECECTECRQSAYPRPARGSVTLVTSLKKDEKQKTKSVNIRYKNGKEHEVRGPNFVDEDVDRGILSFTYTTHDLNTLKRLRGARRGLQDCLEKITKNETKNSRDTLFPRTNRAFVTYFSDEHWNIVEMEELDLSSNSANKLFMNNGTDIFKTYTDSQHEEKLGAPVLVISIDLQDHYTQQGRHCCLIRWCVEKPLVPLIPAITACVINILCIVLVSSISISAVNNVNFAVNTTIMCVNRAVLTSRPGDHAFHSKLDELCTTPQNGNGECCMNSSKAIESLFKMLLSSGESAKWTDLKSMDPNNFVFSKASAHKAYIRTEFAMELSDKHLLSDEFPIFYKDRNCSLGMDPYRHNHVLLEHNREVTVTKEGFQITEAGIYYVYTSVLFKPDTGRPCNDYEYQTWGHWVKLTRPGKFQDDMVLSTYHTCGDNTSRNKDTSYTGRVMYLEAGDKLHAEVSGYGLISYQAYSNFMGLYLIHGGHGSE